MGVVEEREIGERVVNIGPFFYLNKPCAGSVLRVVVRVARGRKKATVMFSGVHSAATAVCRDTS